jgi:hypothetical protein
LRRSAYDGLLELKWKEVKTAMGRYLPTKACH